MSYVVFKFRNNYYKRIILGNKIKHIFHFQGLNVVYFLTETLYSFTPNIYIIFAMIGFEGLLGGAAYANSYHNIMQKVWNIFIHIITHNIHKFIIHYIHIMCYYLFAGAESASGVFNGHDFTFWLDRYYIFRTIGHSIT